MKIKVIKACSLAAVLTFIVLGLQFFPAPLCRAAALEPLEALKQPINQGLALLQEPKYADTSQKEAQRQEMWRIMREIFDFTDVSKRALARNWRSFSADEKKEFVALFSELLGKTYLDKIQGGYHNEKIAYVSQEILSTNKALVKTLIIRENSDIPVDYRMRKRDDLWKVYDVIVEGVSLVKNYRSQFSKILLKKKPKDLIERLKKKVNKAKLSKEHACIEDGFDHVQFAGFIYPQLSCPPVSAGF